MSEGEDGLYCLEESEGEDGLYCLEESEGGDGLSCLEVSGGGDGMAVWLKLAAQMGGEKALQSATHATTLALV